MLVAGVAAVVLGVAAGLHAAAGAATGEEPPSAVDCDSRAGEAARVEALASYRLGQARLDAERWDEAEEHLRVAVRLDPRLPLAHYGLGLSLMAQKRYADAVAPFAASRQAFRCLALDPEERRAGKRRLEEELQTLRSTIRDLERQRLDSRMIRWQEVNGGAPMTLAEGLRIVEQLERRRQLLERWQAGGAAEPPIEIALALGGAHFQAGQLDEAEREFQLVLSADPGSGDAHNNLAVVLMLAGRLPEAEREVKLAEKAGTRVSQRLKDEIRSRQEAAKNRP